MENTTLPFGTYDANDNATALCRAFEFYGVLLPDGRPIPLRHVQQLIANLYSFENWQAFSDATDTAQVQYYDGANDETYKALAIKLAPHLSAPDGADTIKTALLFAAFGCTTAERDQQQRLYGKMPRTLAQWHKLELLARGYAYATRYSRGRSVYEIEMLRYNHDVAVAKVLGIQEPRPPKKPKARVRVAAAA